MIPNTNLLAGLNKLSNDTQLPITGLQKAVKLAPVLTEYPCHWEAGRQAPTDWTATSCPCFSATLPTLPRCSLV